MNSRVVVAAHTEGTLGKHLAVLDVGSGTLLVEDVEQHAVLSLTGHDNNVLEILCSSTDERNSADIYLLDDVGL